MKALEFERKRTGVRRDYESIYSLGLAFAAYAAAESVHGSGFIAAFAAGLTISALDVELCDCFLEYGETTAEMALLFTFVLFGTSIIWSGVAAASIDDDCYSWSSRSCCGRSPCCLRSRRRRSRGRTAA